MTTPTRAARRGASTTDHTQQKAPPKTAAAQTSAQTSTAGHPRAAAAKATRRNSTEVTVPLLGTVKLPAPDELAFLGGVGVLAVIGAIEWPVAVVLGAGHALAAGHRNKVLREFGEALEKA
jgi:hypothetical protein